MIHVTIDALPVSANHMYITRKGGRRELDPRVEAFRGLVLQALLPHRAALPDGPLRFALAVWTADKRKSDIDNFLKVSIDAAALALRFDDTRIWRVEATRMGQAETARCAITIDTWEERCDD